MSVLSTRQNGDTIISEWFNSIKTCIDQDLKLTPLTVTADKTLGVDANVISADSSSAAIDLDLPALADNDKKVYILKATDLTNGVTVNPNGSDTIDGDSEYEFANLNEVVALLGDATNDNWIITATAFDSTGGGGGAGDPSIYGLVNPTDYNLATWDVTNLVTAVMSVNTTTPLFDDSDYQIANAVGASGYVNGPSIETKPGNRQKTNHNEWTYKYAGSAGAFRFDFYNVTDGALIGSKLSESTTAPVRIKPEGWLPDTALNVRTVITVLIPEAFNLNFSRGIYSDKPANDITLVSTQVYRLEQAGSAMLNKSAEAEFDLGAAAISNIGDSVVVAEDDSGNTRTKFVATRKCTVTHINFACTAAASGSHSRIYKNGTLVTKGSTPASASNTTSSTSLDLEEGEFFSVGTSASIANSAGLAYVSFSVIAESPAIIHSSEGSVEEWKAYTPVFTGFGTVSNVNIYSRRVGDSLELRGNFTSGTPAATEARMDFPAGLTSATTIDTLDIAGMAATPHNGINKYLLMEPDVTYLTFSQVDGTRAALVKQNGDIVSTSGRIFSIQAKVPIKYWGGSYKSVITPLTEKTSVKYITASGVAGGGATTGSWLTRPLNTITKSVGWLSLGGDEFTLAPGQYEGNFNGSFFDTQESKNRLYDVTNASTEDEWEGIAGFAATNSGSQSGGSFSLNLSVPTTFRLEYRVTATQATNGIGVGTSWSANTHSEVNIKKLTWA